MSIKLSNHHTEQVNQKSDYENLDESSIDVQSSAENNKASFIRRVGTCFFNLKLEIFTFLFTFSSVLTSVTSTTMIIRKVCLVHFVYNSSICNDLENYTDIKTAVGKVATNYQVGHTLIQTAPAAVLACFIGPWSDRYGRKFPVILSLTGMIVDAIGSTVCAHYLESRAEYYFIPAIFTGLSGGLVTIMTVVYSYCSDSTTLFARTMKFAYIEMAVGFATSFGSTAGGWIYKALGFAAVFLISAGGLITSLIFMIFMIKETRGLDNNDAWLTKLRKLASCKVFLESFTAITKQRPDRGRIQIILLILSLCFLAIGMNSTGDINYLYAHHLFGWDNTTYSNIVAVYAIIGIAILVIIIPLLKYFRITDPFLGLLGTASLVGKMIGVGISRNIPVYHIANVIGYVGGCATFAARSRISKVADDADLGKLFTFVATAEHLLPILTSVVMSQLFVACLGYFPGMPYITLGIALFVPLGVFSWTIFLPKMSYKEANSTPDS